MKQGRYFHDSLLAVSILVLLFFLNASFVPTIISSLLILVYSNIKMELKSGLGFTWIIQLFKTLSSSFLIAVIFVLFSFYVFRPALEYLTGVPLNLGIFAQLEGNHSLLLASICIGWLIGGFMEEIIFRGFFISRIHKILPGKSGVILSLLITSILFGYLHGYQGITGQLLTGLFGFFLGVIFLLNHRKIWMNIFIHGFVNTVSMLLLFFGIN